MCVKRIMTKHPVVRALWLAALLALFIASLLLWLSQSPKALAAKRLPNIILVFADDLGYADIGSFSTQGGAKGYQTPHLDRLAREGMRFTDFYVAQAVCSASRTALLTGSYPNRVGILGALNHTARHGIHADEMTIAEVLKQKGYATAAIGKWHLGHHPQFLPTNNGFDEYLGLPYSNDMWPKNPDKGTIDYPDLPLYDGLNVIERDPDQSQLTTRYTERGMSFIERSKDKPFFLYVAHSMPHVPLFVSDKFKGKTARGLYGDVISEIDWSVGQLLAAVKKHNLDKDTLVIFTSDNGPWHLYGDHGGSAGPLRGYKATQFEGGVRVPFVARWPGRIPAGKSNATPMMTIDVLPTLAEIAGAPLPKLPIDGRSILPQLKGQRNARPPHEALFFFWGRELQAMRSGQWKLHFPHPYVEHQPANGGKRGTVTNHQIELSLYDLSRDLGETTNVAAQHPDVVKRLQALAETMRDDLGDSLTNRAATKARPAGQMR
jgi:arylsulfatase A-like enzyme